MIAAGVQLRAARELLGWSREELCARVAPGDGRHAVKYWEARAPIPTGAEEPHAVRHLRQALEAAGVAFAAGPGGLGVTLRPGSRG